MRQICTAQILNTQLVLMLAFWSYMDCIIPLGLTLYVKSAILTLAQWIVGRTKMYSYY